MDSDLQLLAAWRDGDRDAGDVLLRKHVSSLRRFFHNKVGPDVDDLVQRTLLDCTKAARTFEGRASFRTLMFVIARRQLIRFYERATREKVEDIEGMSVEDLRTSPSQLVARRKEHTLLLAALRRLPLELQTTVELHYWESMSTAQLAEVLDIPQGTVKSRLRRAREALVLELGTFERGGERRPTTETDVEAWASALADLS